MRIMESDGDVMLGTCRGPNSEEALSIPMMLLRGMTNCYTSVKLGGQTDVLLSVESGQFLARALFVTQYSFDFIGICNGILRNKSINLLERTVYGRPFS